VVDLQRQARSLFVLYRAILAAPMSLALVRTNNAPLVTTPILCGPLLVLARLAPNAWPSWARSRS
jgi:hypothetical protein